MLRHLAVLLLLVSAGCSCAPALQDKQQDLPEEQNPLEEVRQLHEPTGTETEIIEDDVVTEYVGEVPDDRPGFLNRRYKSDVFGFSLYYPHDWTPNVNEKNIIFVHPSKDMMFSIEVILSKAAGGKLEDLKSVQDSYYAQLDSLSPVIVNSVYRSVNDKQMLDCSFRYTYNKKDYVNRFAIGQAADYFYVLQFMVPADEYDAELGFLEAVIGSFKYGTG